MSRYYEADALIDFIKKNVPNFNGETTMQCVENAIREAPSVDVVKVVRCEKCRHTESITDVDGNYGLYCVLRNSKFVNPDDFCSSGERKEKNGV